MATVVKFDVTGSLAGVLCINSYELKDYLKQKGFTYNASWKEWRKNVDDMSDQEIKELMDKNIIKNDLYDKIMNYRKDRDKRFARCKAEFDYKYYKRGLSIKGCYEFKDILKELGFKFHSFGNEWEIELSSMNDVIVTKLFENQIISKLMYDMLINAVKYEEKQVGNMIVRMRKFKTTEYNEFFKVECPVFVVLLDIFKDDKKCNVYIDILLEAGDVLISSASAYAPNGLSIRYNLRWYADEKLQEYLNITDEEATYLRMFMNKHFLIKRDVKTQDELEKLEKEFAEITLDIDS